jgi:hypothetical protein
VVQHYAVWDNIILWLSIIQSEIISCHWTLYSLRYRHQSVFIGEEIKFWCQFLYQLLFVTVDARLLNLKWTLTSNMWKTKELCEENWMIKFSQFSCTWVLLQKLIIEKLVNKVPRPLLKVQYISHRNLPLKSIVREFNRLNHLLHFTTPKSLNFHIHTLGLEFTNNSVVPAVSSLFCSVLFAFTMLMRYQIVWGGGKWVWNGVHSASWLQLRRYKVAAPV